jgi:hypothetical protein
MTGRQLKVCLGDIEKGHKCVVKPVFGFPVDVVATYCCTHKKEGMIDIFNKKCVFVHPTTGEKCTKQRTHNFLEIDKETGDILQHNEPKYCAEHASSGMLNLLIRRCGKSGCLVIPSYNYEKMPLGAFCYEHKKENMVCVTNTSLCGMCSKRASYNFRGQKTVLFCEEHAEPGMVNITRTMCSHPDGCDKQARERDIVTGKFLYCTNHFKKLYPGKPTTKALNAIKKLEKNVRLHELSQVNTQNTDVVIPSVDIDGEPIVEKTTTDIVEESKIEKVTKILYDIDGEPFECEVLDDKITITQPEINKTKVEQLTTKVASMYIDEDKVCSTIVKPTYEVDGLVRPISLSTLSILQKKMKDAKTGIIKVESTAPEGVDVRLAKKTCKNIGCLEPGHMNYDRYCRSCFIVLFPEDERVGKYKSKELCVRDYIRKEFPNITLICDRKVIDGCSKRRPDLLIDLGYQVLCIEVDENQHARYEEICENRRMMEIFEDIGKRPLIFIRFNPDSYYKGKIKVTSCWSSDKKCGAQIVKKSSEFEWKKRLDVLRNQVAYWLDENNKAEKELTCVYLFFDSQ